MVKVDPPPPVRPPQPQFFTLNAGTRIYRLFDPTGPHPSTALFFRSFGPLLRFDHHRRDPRGAPFDNPDRRIYYAAPTLSSCIVEVFGDTGIVECGDWNLAHPTLTRDLRLLDLRGSGAMRAGSVAAVAKVPDHSLAQQWSQHFYDQAVYEQSDGLIYYNAHNDEESFAFYERAVSALHCPTIHVYRLDDLRVRLLVLDTAEQNNLMWTL